MVLIRKMKTDSKQKLPEKEIKKRTSNIKKHI